MRSAKSSPELSETIRDLRMKLGLTQSQLAERIGVQLPSVYRYEAGKSVPTVSTLNVLFEFAILMSNREAADTFAKFLTGPNGRKGHPQREQNSGVSDVLVALRTGTEEEQELVRGLLFMLRYSKDPLDKALMHRELGKWARKAQERKYNKRRIKKVC